MLLLQCAAWLAAGLMIVAAANPPKTRIETAVDRMHSVDVPDPYRWLEDQNSPETRAWISAQNAYTRSILDPVSGRGRIRAQLEKVHRFDWSSSPTLRSGRYFYMHRTAAQDQPSIYLREGFDGPERLLVDAQPLSPDHSVAMNILNVTPDGRLLAWSRRKGGADEVEVHFLDVDSGREIGEPMPIGVFYALFLDSDKGGFVYTHRRADGTRVMSHRFGRPFSEDRELFGHGLPDSNLIWLVGSEDARMLAAFVSEGAGTDARTNVYFMDRSRGDEFRPLIIGEPANFQGSFGGQTLYLDTTWKAPRRHVFAVDLRRPSYEFWREVIAEPEDGSVLLNIVPAARHLVIASMKNAIMNLTVYDEDGRQPLPIAFETIGSTFVMRGTPWESNEVFLGFSSYAHPATTYRYDVVSGKRTLWFQPRLPIDSKSIETRQVWYSSHDGTRVPMFVVSKRGVRLDGQRPVLLSAYGGYGSSSTPWFDPLPAFWVQRGGVYAWACIRGGGEFGERWHKDGMLAKKQNSFDDFIAAAEWLVANQYTRPEKLAIEGASNGGMLVAVAAMQRPELFRAVVCQNAHLDMLRYHKFLKAAPWVHEYGNPDVPEEFEYLRKYSPYQAVRQGVKYPAMLFTTGDGDTRVAPLHARKMTARMQAASASGRPILLRYDLLAGHSGAGALTSYIDSQVDELAFLDSQLGVR